MNKGVRMKKIILIILLGLQSLTIYSMDNQEKSYRLSFDRNILKNLKFTTYTDRPIYMSKNEILQLHGQPENLKILFEKKDLKLLVAVMHMSCGIKKHGYELIQY